MGYVASKIWLLSMIIIIVNHYPNTITPCKGLKIKFINKSFNYSKTMPYNSLLYVYIN